MLCSSSVVWRAGGQPEIPGQCFGTEKTGFIANLFCSYKYTMLCHQNDNVLKHFLPEMLSMGEKPLNPYKPKGSCDQTGRAWTELSHSRICSFKYVSLLLSQNNFLLFLKKITSNDAKYLLFTTMSTENTSEVLYFQAKITSISTWVIYEFRQKLFWTLHLKNWHWLFLTALTAII